MKKNISWVHKLLDKAKKDPRRIVLPEGDEPRVLLAAQIAAKEKIAIPIILGNKLQVEKIAKINLLSLKDIEIIEPEKFPDLKRIAGALYELRKNKDFQKEDEAKEFILKELVYFGALMTRLGMADGFVAGASHTTSSVARAAIHCMEIDPNIKIVSSSFIMELENCPYGENGLFIFADCGIVPNPNAEQLAGIAISSSNMMKNLFNITPRVALLSYSTKGSAKGESVDKVVKALEIVRGKAKGLIIDGEFQLDAAIIPEVARIKLSDNPVAGKANVLVFPNLDAGNICYKMVQRLGKARAVGPLLQGLTKPASDLSRGCSVEDIVDTIAATVVRAQHADKALKSLRSVIA